MWQSALQTAAWPEGLELVLYLDEDDRYLETYLALLGVGTCNVIGPRIVLSQMWNFCHARAAGPIFWHGNDDVIFRTQGWDDQVRQAFNQYVDRIVLVHGRDGYHDQKMSVLGFLHRRWVEVVGCFVPPYFVSDYNDQWLSEVADALGRRVFLPEVYTEHLHPNFGKGPLDQTHRDRLWRHQQASVDQLYARLAPERADWVAALRGTMERDRTWEG